MMNDAPCTPEDRAAIVAAADTIVRDAMRYRELTALVPERVNNEDGATTCVVRWMAELDNGTWIGSYDREAFDGLHTVCNPIGETTDCEPDSKVR